MWYKYFIEQRIETVRQHFAVFHMREYALTQNELIKNVAQFKVGESIGLRRISDINAEVPAF